MSEKTTILKVKGMHCEGCANSVGNALRAVKGVNQADVSFEKQSATVTFDPLKVEQGKLEKTIRKAGFEVK